jgi:hypothetical protein
MFKANFRSGTLSPFVVVSCALRAQETTTDTIASTMLSQAKRRLCDNRLARHLKLLV